MERNEATTHINFGFAYFINNSGVVFTLIGRCLHVLFAQCMYVCVTAIS